MNKFSIIVTSSLLILSQNAMAVDEIAHGEAHGRGTEHREGEHREQEHRYNSNEFRHNEGHFNESNFRHDNVNVNRDNFRRDNYGEWNHGANWNGGVEVPVVVPVPVNNNPQVVPVDQELIPYYQ